MKLKTLFASLAMLLAAATVMSAALDREPGRIEYGISLTPDGLTQLVLDSGLNFIPATRIASTFGYMLECYCEQVLELPHTGGSGSPDVALIGVVHLPGGDPEFITLCATDAPPTEKYGYLCSVLGMQFSRIEGKQMICARAIAE